ncbi:MAG: carbonic anhydrase family protein [Alphaproteobacteria bacterium]|nr:MAG: carbonic anhydrase family protein [Alphaproteobacteria bacterium]
MRQSRPHVALGLLIAVLAAPAASAQSHEASGPQSPIDIDRAHSCVAALPPLVLARRSPVTEVWRNTGSPDHEATIRVSADPPAGTLELDGKSYELRQYHFHTPAEHRIDGAVAAMEIHYVFEAADGSLAVVARLVDEGAASAEFDPLLAAMPSGRDMSVTIHSADPLGHVLRPWLERPRTFRYLGSLTTPPFTTGVNWIVLADRITFSGAQMARFKNIFPHGNIRPVQPIEGRTVRTDVAGFSRPC